MRRTLAFVLFAGICLGVPVSADVPQLLSYQGVLADAGGVAVPDGPYNITFRIYDVPSGGSALWTETDAVQVGKGIFNATLGNVTPLASLKFDKAYYLSISVEGGAELPRQALTASPYSLNAQAVVGAANVFPSSGMVGVGTTTPTSPLTVASGSSQAGIRMDGNDDNYANIYVNALKTHSWPGYGYLRGGLLQALTSVDDLNTWDLLIGGVTLTYAIRASQAGNVSIGSAMPTTERLYVDGGVQLGNSSGTNTGTIRWTGSDFQGYNGLTWKSLTGAGVATLPTGTTGQTLRHDASNWVAASNLYNDGTNVGIGTTSPTATLHVGGAVKVGTMTADGDLTLFRSGNPNPLLWGRASNFGGGIYGYDPSGSTMSWSLENGATNITAGRLALMHGPGEFGLFVDSDVDGLKNGYLLLTGMYQYVAMRMDLSNDGSVQLPVNAISSSEILDEPGVANYTTVLGATLSGSFAAYASQTINAPAAGYVLVMGTADVSPNHTNGTVTNIIVSVSNSPTSIPATQNTWLYLPAAMPTATYHYPVTVSGMFQVEAGGSNTFYLDAEVTSGGGTIFERNLSVVYIPTAYGSFIAPLMAASGDIAKHTGGSAFTASDIAATAAASEAANAGRMQKELDTMKAQMAALQEQMKNMQGRK